MTTRTDFTFAEFVARTQAILGDDIEVNIDLARVHYDTLLGDEWVSPAELAYLIEMEESGEGVC